MDIINHRRGVYAIQQNSLEHDNTRSHSIYCLRTVVQKFGGQHPNTSVCLVLSFHWWQFQFQVSDDLKAAINNQIYYVHLYLTKCIQQ